MSLIEYFSKYEFILLVVMKHSTASGLLVPECIIHPVVSAYVLRLFIRYIYNQNLMFL
jgi:hypothetical protein